MVRILVCGDVSNDYPIVQKRLESVIFKSGPFACVLLTTPVGALPPCTPSPSIPTYFAAQEHSGSAKRREVLPHLHYVGAAAVIRESGLTMLLVAGGYDDAPAASPLPDEVALAVREAGSGGVGFTGVDVLVTGTAPQVVGGGIGGSALAARVGERTRGRYHFCSGERFEVGEAFVVGGAGHGTRVVSVAKAGKGRKKGEKWVYAVDVKPLDVMSETERRESRGEGKGYATGEVGEGVREKRAREWGVGDEDEGTGAHLWAKRGRGRGRGQGGGRREGRRRERDDTCWFCLANGREAQLVVDVGRDVYVAVAKGGVNDGHVLIVSVRHVEGSAGGGEEGSERRLEVGRMMEGVREWFRRYKNGAEAMFWESCVVTRGGEGVRHMHVEAVPVRKEAAGRASEVFGGVADGCGMEVVRGGGSCVEEMGGMGGDEYFWAELPDGGRVVKVWKKGEEEAKEELDAVRGRVVRLGREVAATLLGVPERREWRRCVAAMEEQVKVVSRAQQELGQCLRGE